MAVSSTTSGCVTHIRIVLVEEARWVTIFGSNAHSTGLLGLNLSDRGHRRDRPIHEFRSGSALLTSTERRVTV
jgi:hypothetical protein